LDGFRVISEINVDNFTCQQLDNHIVQLAIVLYPVDLVNEKFLIKVRDCMVKLNEKHPVKLWLKAQSTNDKPNPAQQKQIDFLNEMLNSQFNLITDQKVKNQVIALIGEIPGETKLEEILKAYLYLMIGNITRSDNILKSLMQQSPRFFYQGFTVKPNIYEKQTLTHIEKVLRKFSRHPADRLTFYLFNQYIKSFLNKIDLLTLIDDIEATELKDKVSLAYTEKIAPELVAHIRLSKMSDERRMKNLRTTEYSLDMQSYWVWAFLSVDPLMSETTVERLKEVDQLDPLWSIYLLENEKLADLYFNKGGEPVMRRRKFLRQNLKNEEDFMLTLYKLIELGDIDGELINEVLHFMTNNG
jgi:hypothetical protein